MVRKTTPSTQRPYLTQVSCPYCYSSECTRAGRYGFQDFLLRLIGKYPWQCRKCQARFYLRRRVLG